MTWSRFCRVLLLALGALSIYTFIGGLIVSVFVGTPGVFAISFIWGGLAVAFLMSARSIAD